MFHCLTGTWGTYCQCSLVFLFWTYTEITLHHISQIIIWLDRHDVLGRKNSFGCSFSVWIVLPSLFFLFSVCQLLRWVLWHCQVGPQSAELQTWQSKRCYVSTHSASLLTGKLKVWAHLHLSATMNGSRSLIKPWLHTYTFVVGAVRWS